MAHGILVYCANCSRLNPPENLICSRQGCGQPIKSLRQRKFFIEYRIHGRRVRELVGVSSSQREAKQRLAERKTQLLLNPPANTSRTNMSLQALRDWYLAQSEIRLKKSYQRDVQAFNNLLRLFAPETKVRLLSRLHVEQFRAARLAEPSGQRNNALTAVATVNRELRVFNRALNLAAEFQLLRENPLKGMRMLRERNERERILRPDETQALLGACPPHLCAIIIIALNTGMREMEILGLRHDEVNLSEGAIRLSGSRTKSGEGRTIPLFPPAWEVLKKQPRALHSPYVFLYKGNSVKSVKRSFKTACQRAGIEQLWFHDLRRTFITEMARAGFPERLIMAITGHKTRSAFDRYRRVREDEVMGTNWAGIIPNLDTKRQKSG